VAAEPLMLVETAGAAAEAATPAEAPAAEPARQRRRRIPRPAAEAAEPLVMVETKND
jgi:hypothetical protein